MLRNTLVRKEFLRTYIVPSLEHLEKGKDLAGLFSSEGLERAWFNRAELYTKKLNSLTSNTEEKGLESIVRENAKFSSKRQIFNYASLMYNLKFSMSTLRGGALPLPSSKPGPETLLGTPDLSLNYQNEPLSNGSEKLHQALVKSFGSIVEFRTLLLLSNLSMSGDGYTWLVARQFKTADPAVVKYDELFILNTYNAGSPFNSNRAGYMKQMEETLKKDSAEASSKDKLDESVDSALYADVNYIPLLAIDASPKSWLHDYGVFGKRQYLDRVWESIEWKIVENRLPTYESKTFNAL